MLNEREVGGDKKLAFNFVWPNVSCIRLTNFRWIAVSWIAVSIGTASD